jgi:hypothetical protein
LRAPCNLAGFSLLRTLPLKDPELPGNPRTCPQNLAQRSPCPSRAGERRVSAGRAVGARRMVCRVAHRTARLLLRADGVGEPGRTHAGECAQELVSGQGGLRSAACCSRVTLQRMSPAPRSVWFMPVERESRRARIVQPRSRAAERKRSAATVVEEAPDCAVKCFRGFDVGARPPAGSARRAFPGGGGQACPQRSRR